MMILNSIGISKRIGIQAIRACRFNSKSSVGKELNWVEFLKLKKENRRINIVASSITGLGGALLTLTYLGNVEIEADQKIMGFDAIMVFGVLVVVGGGLGYQFGPSLGNPIFNLRHKAILKLFKAKDLKFLQKIQAKRVDPSSQSFSNPVPDYYGERIYSLKDYKQWLRDCNAFRRKAKEFL
ncbi:uncharacterized protein PRCAT00002922001 [Priceomyces carsonii]|uniref:uncharacterized protein n=1 Tax=Priceomyces carsonii TaxID=28549 RepID=UPI002ED93C08|nr:unnamed protein product [Priceomyces carsonii]